ncbi:MAG: Spy/CpxP family protein refolding chaperone [Gemmatimonadaceae bacterium]
MKNIVRVGLALGLVAGTAVAQNPPAQPNPAAQPQPQARAGMRAQARAPQDRAQLEQQIRNRIANQLKNQLKLSDDQFTKLQATNKRFEEKRRLLVEQERDARMSMRDLILAGDTTNQAKVSGALDKMMQIQRQRFELVEQEQKELAGYLTPMQRARFLGMQEQMRRRMDDMRAQAGRRGAAGPGAGAGMGQGMGPGMGPGMGQGMGPGMGPGAGVRPGAGQRPAIRQGVRPPNPAPVPPFDEIIP